MDSNPHLTIRFVSARSMRNIQPMHRITHPEHHSLHKKKTQQSRHNRICKIKQSKPMLGHPTRCCKLCECTSAMQTGEYTLADISVSSALQMIDVLVQIDIRQFWSNVPVGLKRRIFKSQKQEKKYNTSLRCLTPRT